MAEIMRRYKVGTFPGEGKRQPRAYLRDYHPSWSGCVVITVEAPSGKVAKRMAIMERIIRDGILGESDLAQDSREELADAGR